VSSAIRRPSREQQIHRFAPRELPPLLALPASCPLSRPRSRLFHSILAGAWLESRLRM